MVYLPTMNQLSCFIVEDDPQAMEYATTIVNEVGNITVLGNSPRIDQAAIQVQKLQPDFVILDVFLEDGNAFDFLKLFDTISFKIIFTTSFAKYAIDAFRYSAVDYLLKPYHKKELIKAINRIQELYDKKDYEKQLRALVHNFSNPKENKKLILKNSDAVFIVDVNNILYAKSDNNYTTFYIKDDKSILVSGSLRSYEEKVGNHHFFRVHQSYLVHLKYISSFNKKSEDLILTSGHAIPVAQSKKQKLMHFIETLK